jgi:hypothetical protein
MFHVLVIATSNRALGSDCCAALCHRPQRGLDRSAAEISWEEISQLDMIDVSFGAVASQPEAAPFFDGYRIAFGNSNARRTPERVRTSTSSY